MPRARFEEREDLLDFLLEVSDMTSSTLDLDQILDRLAEILRDTIGYDLFAVFLYTDRRQRLRVRYSIGHREELVRNLEIHLGEGLVGHAAKDRVIVNSGDVKADPRYLSANDAVRSEIVVPMVFRGRLVGVFDLQSTRPQAYRKREEALLSLLATRVASSVDNAQLYRRVEKNHRTLKLLTELTKEFSTILELDTLLEKIASSVRQLIHYDGFSIWLVNEELEVLQSRFSLRFDQRQTIDIPLTRGVTGAAVRARHAIRVSNTDIDERYIATTSGIRSEVAVPLVLHDKVIGVMDLESEKVNFFTEDHTRMLGLLAPQIAASIENARLYDEVARRTQRMEADLDAARRVQSLLLPRHVEVLAGLEIGMSMRPAREISGDIYDIFPYDESSALIAFGDSSGKGAAAALYGAMVSGLLRTREYRELEPAAMMRLLNDRLCERKVEGQYVTLLLARWNGLAKQLTLSSAGAGLPVLLRGKEVQRIHMEGVPLGLLEGREYDQVTVHLEAGDLLGFFSDGFEDQANAAGEHYGEGSLARAFVKHRRLSPCKLISKLMADLDAFRGNLPIHDDQSAIVFRIQ
ncbi:MAG: GAF domain-containing protein [Bryobacter sp.]|nr:GAF domain-containing protein [Bryobacter sp.]